jgi:hypothetical protein
VGTKIVPTLRTFAAEPLLRVGFYCGVGLRGGAAPTGGFYGGVGLRGGAAPTDEP